MTFCKRVSKTASVVTDRPLLKKPRSLDGVLIFLPCLTYGGAERQGFALAQHLASAGHRVEVWGFPAPSGRAPLKADLNKAGIPWRELTSWPRLEWSFSRTPPDRHSLAGYRDQWREQLREFDKGVPQTRFEIVIPFTFWPCLIATLLLSSRADVVFWNHRGGDHDAGIHYSSFLVEQIQKHAPVFMANSRSGASFLRRVFKLRHTQVHHVPNVFLPDTDFGPEDAPRESRTDPMRVIQVANFFPEKDVETVVRALVFLQGHRPKVELHLVGYFPDPAREATVRRLCTDLGVQDSVFFHGGCDRQAVAELLRDAHIGLLSSVSEGAPNAVMEYMYFCLPIVATAIPGVCELLGSHEREGLFPVGDARSLARNVEAFAANPELRLTQGLRNRKRLDETYRAAHVLPVWSSLLEDVRAQ